jgi:hypothetical protein
VLVLPIKWVSLRAPFAMTNTIANNSNLENVSIPKDGKMASYRLDVALEGFRDSLSVFGVLLGDDGEVADFIAIVLRQIAQ